MNNYVLGFLFTNDLTKVALIKKLRPDWQAGRVNGIGGKVEDGEDPLQAMNREFLEETGVGDISWKGFGNMHGEGFKVHLFTSIDDRAWRVRTQTDEKVILPLCSELEGYSIVSNLSWLVPAAREAATSPGVWLDIEYSYRH